MNLIVGLGNPGKAYANNRHNVGFRCINKLAKLHGIPLAQRGSQAQFGIGQIAGKEVVLAKPRTFMNLSGKSVKLLMQRFQVTPSNVLIIHDDLDLPLGKIRLYSGGGSGGHNTLEEARGDTRGWSPSSTRWEARISLGSEWVLVALKKMRMLLTMCSATSALKKGRLLSVPSLGSLRLSFAS